MTRRDDNYSFFWTTNTAVFWRAVGAVLAWRLSRERERQKHGRWMLCLSTWGATACRKCRLHQAMDCLEAPGDHRGMEAGARRNEVCYQQKSISIWKLFLLPVRDFQAICVATAGHGPRVWGLECCGLAPHQNWLTTRYVKSQRRLVSYRMRMYNLALGRGYRWYAVLLPRVGGHVVGAASKSGVGGASSCRLPGISFLFYSCRPEEVDSVESFVGGVLLVTKPSASAKKCRLPVFGALSRPASRRGKCSAS